MADHQAPQNPLALLELCKAGEIAVSQLGQCDGGCATDSPRGTRQITTLRNDPITRPRTAQTSTTNAVTGTIVS